MPPPRSSNPAPPSRARLRLERLEDRTTPAVNGTLVGTTLQVTLDAAGDEARLGVNGPNLEVRDGANFLVFAAPAAGVTDLTFTGTATGAQAVVWNDAVSVASAAVAGVSSLTVNGSYTLTGSLNVTLGGAAGGVTDGAAGVLSVGGAATFAAGATRDVTLDNVAGHAFGSVAFASANNVVLQGQGGVTLAASAVAGTLTVRANGAVTQTGALSAPAASFTTGAGQNVTLGGANDFGTVAFAVGGNVTLNDISDLAISGAVGGALAAAAAGALTDAAALTAGGAATLNGGSVTFDNADDFQGVVAAASAGPVAVNDVNNLTVGGITAAATVTLTAGGAIVDGNGVATNVTAASLAATAVSGIGSGDALETAVANLEAQTATGGISIANTGNLTVGGVDATLTGVRVVTTGDIALTNAGGVAINLAGEAVTGPGTIVLAATGAASDLTTGGGQIAVASTAGPVSLTAGRNLRLGGAAATLFGDVRGVGLTLAAGTDIVVDGETLVDSLGIGTLTATAGRDITVTGTTGGTGPRFSTAGGVIALTAPRTLTLAAALAPPAVRSNNGNVTVIADDMVINRGIDAGTGCVTLQPFTAGRTVDLGTETPGRLSLTSTELALVTAADVLIGQATSPVIVSAPVSLGTVVLRGTTLTETGTLTATNLGLQFSGAVSLDGANQIARVAGSTGALSLTSATPLVVGSFTACGTPFDGLTAGGDVTITADTLDIASPINAGTFCVTLQQRTVARLVDVGNEVATRLSLTDAELKRVTARVLRVGRTDGGAVEVTAAVAPTGTGTLVLRSGASVSEVGAGTLTVPNLAVRAGTTVTLAGANVVQNLAGVSGGAFRFVNVPDLTVTAIDTCDPALLVGVTTTNAAIDLTVTGAGRRLTVLSPVNAGNAAVTLTADDMTLSAAVNAGTQRAILQSNAAGRAIDLGADTAGTLGLTDAELDRVTAGTLQIGNAAAGAITVRAPVSPGGTATLALQTAAGVVDQNAAGADIAVTNLAIRAVTGIGSADPLETQVGNLAFANATGSVRIDDIDGLVVAAVDGLATSANANGNIAISARGPLTFAVDVTAGGALTGTALETTPAAPNVSNVAVNAGVTLRANGGDLNLLAGDRIALSGNLIASQSVRLASASGDNDGDGQQTLAGNVTAGTRATLDLGVGGAALQTAGAIVAPQLLLLGTGVGGSFTLAQAGNDADTLAAATAATVVYRDADALLVATVGTTNGVTVGGDLTLNSGPLTLGDGGATPQNVTAAGTVDITAAGVTQNANSALVATNLRLRGNGVFSLPTPANNVATLAADVTGPLTFRDADSLVVGTVAGTAGIRVSGVNADVDAVTLVTGTDLTVNNVIDAGGPGGGRIVANTGRAGLAVVTLAADVLARRATFNGGDFAPNNRGDTFQILPSATTPIFVNGGKPTQVLPGDSLRVTLQRGEAGTKLTPGAPGSGVFTFDNRQPVTFTEIESLTQANLLAFVLQTGAASFTIGVQARVENFVSGTVPVSNIPNNTFVVSPQLVNPFQPFGAPRLAVGDVNGDGIPDLIVGFGPNNVPLVTVFDGVDVFRSVSTNPRVLAQFYAYDPRFVGGLFVAAADFNGDGRAEIITAPDLGGGPHVRVLFFDPNVPDPTRNVGEYGGPGPRSFFPFDPRFVGGVRVATGDVNGDGTPELITAAGPGGGPHVRTFDGKTGGQLAGPLGSFFAYETTFHGGVFVAAGDDDSDGKDDIMTGPGQGGAARVRVFSGATGGSIADFNAFPSVGGGGSIIPGQSVPLVGVGGLAFSDVDGDGLLDILVGTGRGTPARLRTFRGNRGNPTEVISDYSDPRFADGFDVASFGQ